MTPLAFIIGSLAVWRLSHGLVKENGPLMLFARLRARLARSQKRSGGFFDLFSCVYCISFWIGLGASLFVAYSFFSWIGYAFAFSGVAMLLESFFSKQTNTLAVVTPPATDNKVSVRTSTTPEQGDNVVSHPRSTDGSVAVKATTLLDS